MSVKVIEFIGTDITDEHETSASDAYEYFERAEEAGMVFTRYSLGRVVWVSTPNGSYTERYEFPFPIPGGVLF